ncbi:hypothetical protein Tco_1091390 [Tanacetum coccineum]|uniref:Uncharacterized protein n=1 Tax=Tanacetum coccineum TaxID=301880 RepID=A0ABQ5I996_9ASTR
MDTSPRYKNDNQTGHFGNQRTINIVRAKESVVEKGVSLRVEQSDWLDDTNEEIDEKELEAHYSFMAKIQEVVTAESGSNVEPLEKVQSDTEYSVFSNERHHYEQPESINDTYVVEKVDSNVIPDSSGMCDNDNQADQNAEECDDERVVLANLIANLKLDTDENKKIQKQLKKANTSLSHELKECTFALEMCKSSLEESNRTRDRYLGALHDQEAELAKYKIAFLVGDNDPGIILPILLVTTVSAFNWVSLHLRKKANSDTSPKQKPVQATKGTRIKSKAKVSKSDKKKQPAKKPKAKGLAVLSESKVSDEQHLEMTGADEGASTILGVPDVPIYKSESEKESWGESEDEDNENNSDDISDEGDDNNDGNDGDDDANDDDKQEGDDMNDDDEETDGDRIESDRIKIPILDQSTTEYYEEEKIDDEETIDEEEDDEVTKDLYDDVNVNLGNEDTEMTNVDQADNEIASLMETSARHATTIPKNTSGFTITIPLPPPYSDSTTEEAINKAILAHNLDFRQEAQDEKNAYIELIPPQAVSDFANPVIEKNVTESVEAAVLTRSSSQPTSTYEEATSLFEFELTKILIDKMEKNKSYDKADYKKKLYDALVESFY